MAWLQAVPKPDEDTKRAKMPVAAPRLSRFDALKKDKIVPAMPPNSAPHISDRLVEIGLSEAAGMGVAPLSWQTLDAWCSRTRVNLAPWESRLIRRLSIAYLAEGHRAESENCPPPWRAPVTEREISLERAGLDMLLG